MPDRLIHSRDAEKRRALIALSVSSVAAILLVWILYMNWSLDSPDAMPHASIGQIFGAGSGAITHSIETGLVNSYLYFHSAMTSGNTFVISK